ncbi:MAG: glycosyltransferase family 1 protein [Acidobacteriota bacterium]
MKIGLDIRSFLSRETGVGVYFKNLLNGIAKIDKFNEYFLFSSSLKERFPEENLPPFQNYKLKDLKIPVSLLNSLWFRFKFPPLGMFFGNRLDLVHSPNPILIPGGKKKIITVHDLSFIDLPDYVMPEAVKYFSGTLKSSLEKADKIITVSEFTKERILEHFGSDFENKISYIYHGCDLDEITEKPVEFELPRDFLLFTGTLEPRKNLTTLIKAFSLVRQKQNGVKLILAGKKGWMFNEIRRMISILKLEDEILISEYLNREQLKFLYKKAKLLVFPSHYEGFGLPLLEAANSGLPVIASDLKVFKEIFSDFPVYFNKDDPEDLGEKILSLYDDSTLYKRKKTEALSISKKFSWEKAAEKTLEIYNELS